MTAYVQYFALRLQQSPAVVCTCIVAYYMPEPRMGVFCRAKVKLRQRASGSVAMLNVPSSDPISRYCWSVYVDQKPVTRC
jgi:hypothetical protein